jgi:UDP-N-acetylmuramoyl-tripeptide--D-alanyl-D-alanine ligase
MMTPLWRGTELAGLFGQDFHADISGVSIDTRTLQPGDLFIALADARDGHDFVGQAVSAGAAAVMVHKDVDTAVPQLRVADTYEGLWQLGRGARQRFQGRVVALTGSSGKTTLRSWFEHVLTAAGSCHASTGSLNNHWGVPLSLARMPHDAAYAVLEVGTNHPGEIAPLSELVSPHVSLLLNVLPAHIGNFDGLDALTEEKLCIATGLSEGGKFVVPSALQKRSHWSDMISFGGAGADVTAEVHPGNLGTNLDLNVLGQPMEAFLPFHGRERVESTLALVAVLKALDVDLAQVLPRLADLPLPEGRGNLHQVAGVVIVDDSYNANPGSMSMSLRSFANQQAARKFALLGEMLELGDAARRYHQEIAGETGGLEQVFSFGEGFEACEFEAPATHYAAIADFPLVEFVGALREGDAVLVKGSNKVFWVHGFVRDLIAALENRSNPDSA